jgi:predicted nucleic acid-binding protein
MIFIDSGAIYAIFDKNDTNHKCAAAYYKENIKEETFIITTPILIECWFLIESRLGAFFSQKFLDAVHSNIFVLREISYVDFENALTINKKYDTAGFGLVDSLSFAFIERNKINKIFTFDRKHFSIYMPDNLKEMTLVPDIY